MGYQFNSSSYKIQVDAKFFQVQNCTQVYAGPFSNQSDNVDGFSILVPIFLKIKPCATNLIQVVTK